MARDKASTSIELAALSNFVGRLDKWRATREGGGRIPDEFWDEAAALAQTHGVSAVSRAARLHYTTLREKVAAFGEDRRSSPRFIEFNLANLPSLPAAATAVKLGRGDGSRMVVRSPTAEGLRMLAHAFLGT